MKMIEIASPARRAPSAIFGAFWKHSMADQINFRLAEPDDAEGIVSVIHRAFRQYDGTLVPPSGAMQETAATVATRLASEGCILALAEVTPVGCVFYKATGGQIYLSRLAVLPERRGKGLARRLIAEVEAAARAARIATVTLGVRIALPENVALFAALGYREISRHAHPGFTEPTSLTMEKRVGAGP
jgi:GNAT superfamily N-acetyltransferase